MPSLTNYMIQQCSVALECSENIFKIVKDRNLVLWQDTNWASQTYRVGVLGGRVVNSIKKTQFGTSRVWANSGEGYEGSTVARTEQSQLQNRASYKLERPN